MLVPSIVSQGSRPHVTLHRITLLYVCLLPYSMSVYIRTMVVSIVKRSIKIKSTELVNYLDVGQYYDFYKETLMPLNIIEVWLP